MSADEATHLDEQFADWLAASAEALADGLSPTLPDPNVVPAELRPRMQRALAGLRLLQKLRPAHSPGAGSSQAPADPPWKTLGRFQLCRELGRGGFGVVYLARDPLLRREVALKVPRPEAVVTPELRARFYQEARAASSMQHPNLVTVYEAGEVGPVCFIVYAYCPGITLAQWLKEQTEPVPFHAGAGFVATLADAVAHAHQHGVVHRDLKPSNILLVSGGLVSAEAEKRGDPPSTTHHSPLTTHQPHITDFGLAKNFLDGGGDATTRSGAILGTVSYMAPEQARGKTRDVGPGVDIYALGTILYELLAGRTPFRGESDLDTLLQVQSEEPLSPARLRRRLPRDLETICLKCLQKEPQGRYGSAAALAEDLRRFLAGEPIRARPVSAGERLLRWCKRNPLPAALTGSVVVLLLVLSAGSLITAQWMQQGRHRAEQAERDARAELCRSYFAQACASRRGNGPGRRFHSLEILSKAIQLRDELGRPDLLPTDLELRNELIGCLALADLSPAPHWDTPGYRNVAFDASLEIYARSEDPDIVRVARVSGDQELFRFHGGSSGTAFLRLSPDGRFVAFVQNDGRLQIGDVQRQQRFLPELSGLYPGALDFNADSSRLAIGRRDSHVIVYDLDGRAPVMQRRVSVHPERLALHRDGRTLAICDQHSGAVIVHDLVSDKMIAAVSCPEKVGNLTWSGDGKLLGLAGGGGRIFLWENVTRQLREMLGGHESGGVYLSFDPTGSLLASFGWDGMLHLWDVRSGTRLFSARSTTHDLRFSSDGCRLASSINGTQLGLWQVAPGRECRSFTTGYPKSGGSRSDISDDGRLLAITIDGAVKIWDLESGREMATLATLLSRSAVFTPDGQALLTGGADGLYRWPLHRDSGSAGLLRIGPPHKDLPDDVALCRASPSGQIVGAILRGGGTILQLGPPIAKGALIKEVASAAMAISSDGRWVASGPWNSRGVRVWDTRRQQVTMLLSEFGGFKVCFSPDDRWLVVSAAANVEDYRTWAVGSWEPHLRLPRSYGGRVPGPMAFSRDGKLLAVETSPARVQLLNPATGQEYATLEHPGGRSALWLGFTQDDTKLIVLGGHARTLQIWDLRLLRGGLADYALDWDLPPYPPAGKESSAPITEIKVELSADFLADRGYEHARRQEFELAVADYDQALTLDAKVAGRNPRHAEACNELAWQSAIGPAQYRVPARTLRLAEEAARACPENWNYRNTLGVIYYRLGRWQDAVTTLQAAAGAKGRGDSAAWDLYFLAMAHHRLSDNKRARACHTQAHDIQQRAKRAPDQMEELEGIRREAEAILNPH